MLRRLDHPTLPAFVQLRPDVPVIFVGARLTRVAIMKMKSRGLGSFKK